MKTSLPINVDTEIMSGTPVFAGTRVPVDTLINYILDGVTLDEFLENFPTVKREDAARILESIKDYIHAGTAG